ncbi:hypothetical protein TREMEDRAFT_32090 [Tremella mesenterica DSM 1558]|uniref:uncharacterized protein n=1 Tax=Tremella mesenterica (strain ATCC 24925 / CBS 8224 / DSM 1558 / NBRC 9311 / NRRL Y-6157 / RJB 2259-6 / UBC 559-6) TaxID=578456 RepID=UPI0003F49FDC|nr:uncharacterized protein TREMEDRAFT_32090 [Tremella mesenterica DSM 1558]EIW68358.1 hypothetical protein TREMEDRAFT_32090 [Tremella mesenterica DSM 1558]
MLQPDPNHLLARLTRLTSTISGLDASLMLAQYSSPFVIAILLRLARFRADHPRVRMTVAAKREVVSDRGMALTRLAEGWGRAAGSIADARVIMRAFGLLPVIQGLLKMYPDSIESLLSFYKRRKVDKEKLLPTLKLLSLLAYYPLEHIYWLANKGVLDISVRSADTAMLWGCRFWALYVLLEIYRLRQTYLSLLSRTRALKSSKSSVTPAEAEGYELQDPSTSDVPPIADSRMVEKKAVRKGWVAWKDDVLVNL